MEQNINIWCLVLFPFGFIILYKKTTEFFLLKLLQQTEHKNITETTTETIL